MIAAQAAQTAALSAKHDGKLLMGGQCANLDIAFASKASADIGDAINTACRNKSEIPWDIFGVKTVGCMFAKDATLFIGQRQWQKPQRQMPKRDKLFWR